MSVMSPKDEFLDYSCEEWSTGGKMEFILYEKPIEGEHPSDQLQLLITPTGGERRGWLMNIEDAVTIIRGLSRLVDNALATGKPVSGDYEELRAER